MKPQLKQDKEGLRKSQSVPSIHGKMIIKRIYMLIDLQQFYLFGQLFIMYLIMNPNKPPHYIDINQNFSYSSKELLGSGSYGKVYRGWDLKRNHPIAVKHIPRKNLDIIDGLEKREIEVMQMLNHPNVMQYYGSSGGSQSPDGLFMFLELCERGTLSHLITKKLTEAQAVEFFKQFIEGMAYVNSRQIFHRDLKPDNLLITHDNKLKIADFGVARQMTSEAATYKRGTPIYCAPQVYLMEFYDKSKGRYSEKCDVFSAGYILYEMLTSEQLTKGINSESDLCTFLNINKQKGSIQFDHPALNPNWVSLLKLMLSFDPKKRPTFLEIKEMLRTFHQPKQTLSQLRPYNQKQINQSKQLGQDIISFLKVCSRKLNYYPNILKIIEKYQKQCYFLPRVYKLLLIYLSLARYCLLAEDLLVNLNKNPNQIQFPHKLPDKKLFQRLLVDDRARIFDESGRVADKANKGVEEIHQFLLGNIIPELQNILQLPNTDYSRIVFEECQMKQQLQDFKTRIYSIDGYYRDKILFLVNNLYRTNAEIQTMSLADLKVYIVLLVVAKLDKCVDVVNYGNIQWPITSEQATQMNQNELIKHIEILKDMK